MIRTRGSNPGRVRLVTGSSIYSNRSGGTSSTKVKRAPASVSEVKKLPKARCRKCNSTVRLLHGEVLHHKTSKGKKCSTS